MGISEAVNDLARRGLTAPEERMPFPQRSSAMGQPSLALDDDTGLLETLEGDAHSS